MNRSSSTLWIAIAAVVVILICCICVFTGAGAALLLYLRQGPGVINFPTPVLEFATPFPTPVIIRPSAVPTKPAGSSLPEGTETPGLRETPGETPAVPTPQPGNSNSLVPTDTLKILSDSVVPVNDLVELAQRLEHKGAISATLAAPAQPLVVGAEQSFWVMNTDDNQNFKVQATLRYVTPHLYFWIENGTDYNQNDLKKLAETFENKIYPTDREFFGSEWSPGIDNDPHLYVLYAHGIGDTVAGYFSSGDEYPPQAVEYSNGHEMFLLSSFYELSDEYAYTVLAHEFQHMIHWHTDRNEELWINEGFADLAAFLNGYGVGGADILYTQNPDIQLNDWPTVDEERAAHYGASFLFLTYLLDRFGEDVTKAIVADPANGLTSIDEVLAAKGITDPAAGKPVTADDIFTDWTVASYLNNGRVGDGRFTYHNYSQAPSPDATEEIRRCPTDQTRDVSQYGADYIRIRCQGNFTLHLEGSIQTGVLPTDPHSGNYYFWSNKGDESDMTLTRTFDFTSVSGPLSFSYWTWYDLEKDYDYVYLEASTDGGKTWQILKTPSGTSEDPSGNSYGWGYNGTSGGQGAQWNQEKVDISQFAGQSVQLRFEYVTDAGVNGEGFLIDDVSIPEINYTSDFESDEGGWEAAGFVRIRNLLPQTYRLAIISEGRDTTVQEFTLTGNNAIDIPLTISGNVKDVVLVVSGTTRFTRQKAPYHFTINR